jgi:F420-0:gamma-glutamyl ligase
MEYTASTIVSENISCDEELFLREKNKEKDPVKVLESLKKKIEKRLKDGEISKERADKLISKIDKQINEIKEFRKLSLEERLKKKLEENKISQEEADEILKKEKKKILDWDGSSNPDFLKRYFFQKKYKD